MYQQRNKFPFITTNRKFRCRKLYYSLFSIALLRWLSGKENNANSILHWKNSYENKQYGWNKRQRKGGKNKTKKQSKYRSIASRLVLHV